MIDAPNLTRLVSPPLMWLMGLATAWKIVGFCLRRFFMRKFTVMDDLVALGSERASGERIRGTAIICGGSIAGLYAARVCADHFERVVIVESEEWLATEEGTAPVCDEKGEMYCEEGRHERTRVMQTDVLHVYQSINYIAMRKLFPGLEQEFARRDARTNNDILNVYTADGKVPEPVLDKYDGEDVPAVFTISRETYEKTLRFMVRTVPNITWVTGTVVDLCCTEGDFSDVKAVKIRKSRSNEHTREGSLQEIYLPAALVIDCTGRARAGFKWLKRIHSAISTSSPGVHPVLPTELKYALQGRYQTLCFNITPKMRLQLNDIIPGGYDKTGWVFLYIPVPGQENRGVIITKIEGNRIKVGLACYGDSQLPETVEELEPMLRSLKSKEPFPSWVFDVVKVLREDETYSSDSMKIPPCSWLKYEKATHIPHNFIAIGDAVMCANPVWGQGCSKAVLGAITLDAALRRVKHSLKYGDDCSALLPRDFSRKFFASHCDKIRGVWDGSKPIDYGYSSTVPVAGETLDANRFEREYARLLVKAALNDKALADWFWKNRLFLAPVTDLMHPYVLFKVGAESMREYLSQRN